MLCIVFDDEFSITATFHPTPWSSINDLISDNRVIMFLVIMIHVINFLLSSSMFSVCVLFYFVNCSYNEISSFNSNVLSNNQKLKKKRILPFSLYHVCSSSFNYKYLIMLYRNSLYTITLLKYKKSTGHKELQVSQRMMKNERILDRIF